MPKIRKCLRMDMAKNQKCYTPEFKQQIMELSKYAAYSMTAELTVKAVENACLHVRDTKGFILHSDLGSQYTSQAFEKYLDSNKNPAFFPL